MENTHTDQSLFEINYDENIKQQMKGAAQWGGLAAIVSIIGSGLGVVGYFVEKQKGSSITYTGYNDYQVQKAADTGGFVSVVISLIIGIVLFYFLNKFSRSVKKGLETNDNYFINEGLGSLSSYFKVIGILLIVVIVLVGLAALIGLSQ